MHDNAAPSVPARLAGLFAEIGTYSPSDLQAAFGKSPEVPRERAALLVIDVYQVVFEDGPMSCGPAAHEAAPTLLSILAAARASGIPVLHSTGEDRSEARPIEATQMAMGVRSAARLRSDYAPYEGFAPAAGESVIYKSAASAFFETRLRTFLQSLGVRSLVVIGESTSGCVRASVVDAYSAGFDVLVPFDAVFDRNATSHAVNLYDMGLKYASVISAASVEASWSDRQEEVLTRRARTT